MTKAKMIDFIMGIEHYPTMNSWNQSNGYSFNVKIHSLPFNAAEKNALYEMLDTDEYADAINDTIGKFDYDMRQYGEHIEGAERCISLDLDDPRRKNGQTREWIKNDIKKPDFSAGLNGRSAGHLVLYHWNGHNMGGTGWVHDREDLEEMDLAGVKYVYNILRRFEQLRDELVKTGKYLAENYKVEDEEYTVKKLRKVLKEKDNQ